MAYLEKIETARYKKEKESMENKPSRMAPAARRGASPATLTRSARGKRAGARRASAPEGLALRTPDRVR